MKRSLSMLSIVALIGSMAGCESPPKAVPLGNISFPVVLITGTHPSSELPYRAEVVADREELGLMSIEAYWQINDTTRTNPPIVIDATAAAFDMRDIKGERGGLWMMVNPTSRMPISFALFPRKESGIEAARGIIAKSKYMGRDREEERTKPRAARILNATSMGTIMQIIDEVPTPNGIQRPRPFEPKD